MTLTLEQYYKEVADKLNQEIIEEKEKEIKLLKEKLKDVDFSKIKIKKGEYK